ncbi:hypothetical protein L1987_78433 [Smallanthus sonchifolius]|uniref:Uncharacterized protein n=1 Tax=Smallanthus sonchifolius TaxID=185202 RepID=A0ACB8ZCG2_9ASTR|nr:hypothetical protein L1987_78433 [Smallanthus sonchifolius]
MIHVDQQGCLGRDRWLFKERYQQRRLIAEDGGEWRLRVKCRCMSPRMFINHIISKWIHGCIIFFLK